MDNAILETIAHGAPLYPMLMSHMLVGDVCRVHKRIWLPSVTNMDSKALACSTLKVSISVGSSILSTDSRRSCAWFSFLASYYGIVLHPEDMKKIYEII